ncbi:MAG: phosphoheptose isomerase [Ignavibacteria bacterium CG_4_8_14_3_um_filter_37_9]|nr:D-sedoheptulose 7-phosphate isomerase [Ignavibacteria bacterium]OIO22147.1 MAG: phosphoheptose isomerase [Ignavibacteria bacterium CG1_02_37_35]PIP76469.1 MAG: phosphoheptose isomerase [Ignavibacteria bacterium CG22_combo_CG10-13_8_21_14_all_37_15]PIS45204.1 MAG: phosphoheptose isomerase [Ignavibacteria bacterium CG08_land_8_20_14_0_20_37_9]PIW99936.1 MAG: phosphoheptose isomerase [Ignavibacteria bacterium CG_4_8_14_3_um_filter_37_9]PIX94796.1 MAG: phosphoheptose isomerase [Ignavibacteria b
MDNQKFISDSLIESSETKLKILESCTGDIEKAVDLLVSAYKNGMKLLLCGNGGSAADCQHIATELMIRLSHHIQRPALPAIALTTDSSNLTAGGNDIGYENVFARNVEGLGNEGDILLAISTSGNSSNVLKAVEKAHSKGMKVIGFLGGNGGKLKSMVDIPVVIPSTNTQRIQEGHITVAHIICELTEEELYGEK